MGLHQHVAGQSVEQAVSQADARMYAEKQAAQKNGVATQRPT
jgi:hypothetical protein